MPGVDGRWTVEEHVNADEYMRGVRHRVQDGQWQEAIRFCLAYCDEVDGKLDQEQLLELSNLTDQINISASLQRER